MAKRDYDQAFLEDDEDPRIFDPEIDVALAEALVESDRRHEELGGGLSRAHEPLLEFNFTPTVHRERTVSINSRTASNVSKLDSSLDPRSFRESRIENRVSSIELRGTVNLPLSGTV